MSPYYLTSPVFDSELLRRDEETSGQGFQPDRAQARNRMFVAKQLNPVYQLLVDYELASAAEVRVRLTRSRTDRNAICSGRKGSWFRGTVLMQKELFLLHCPCRSTCRCYGRCSETDL